MLKYTIYADRYKANLMADYINRELGLAIFVAENTKSMGNLEIPLSNW